jgi:GNAT superfamily N-acetyltransferase
MNTVATSIPPHLLEELYCLPNQAGVCSLINQTCLGEAFPNEPSKFVLLKTTAPFCYLAGGLDDGELMSLLQYFKTFPEILLICDERHHTRLLLQGMKSVPRIQLFYKNPSINITMPPGLTFHKILDADFGRQCPWFEVVGSHELFFQHRFGIAVCEGNVVLSAAYAACVGNNHCEIAIATHPEHQNKGAATLAVKAAIQECLERGWVPEWSCEYSNAASLRVALKTGFTLQRYYSFLTLEEK